MVNWIKKKTLLISFLIPLLICIVICIGNGVYPFGNNCLLHMDLYHQYCPFFTELWNKLRNGGSLMYSWNIGLGSDFVSVYAYYLASPLNWLIVLFPRAYIIEFIELLIILKIALSGMGFFFFLKEHYEVRGKMLFPAYVFSTAYAFSGFIAAYSWNVMWMDVVALAPFVIAGLERMIKCEKPQLYYITLSLAILSNYYLSIMLCIFLVMYFLWIFWTEKIKRVAAVVRFVVYSLLAGGTAAVLIIPELIILGYSGSAGIEFPKTSEWYFNLVSEIGRMCVAVDVYEGNEHWPNLYAGIFALMLIFIFLLNKKIKWQRKIAPILLVILFMISFSNNILDFIWHGLHYPNSLPGRQSYLFIFTILFIGFSTLKRHRGIYIWHILVSAILTGVLIVVGTYATPESIRDFYSMTISLLFVVVYTLLGIMLKTVKGRYRAYAREFLCGLTIMELAINFAVTGLGCTSRLSYNENIDDIQLALDMAKEDAKESGTVFYRVEDTQRLTKNDDARYGYASATQFSSLMNVNVSHFYQKLYMEGGKNFYCYNGATPLTSAMLSVGYMITDTLQAENPITTLVSKCNEHYLYKNNYTLPLGFVMDDKAIEKWDSSYSSNIYTINTLGKSLGASDSMLEIVDCKQYVNEGLTTLEMEEEGYYYAAYDSCTADNLTFSYGLTKNTYSKTTHRYLFNIGYVKAGETIEVTNQDDAEVRFNVYRLNIGAVETAYNTLNEQTLNVKSISDTHVSGNIDMKKKGRLILSIPAERGWKMLVDGKETDFESFSDTFISVSLDVGYHEVELTYETPGLRNSAIMSGCCLLCFILLMVTRVLKEKHIQKKRK